MRYTRILIILMALTLTACATATIVPTDVPAPAVATADSASPSATVPPATLAPAVVDATESAIAEPPTLAPTAEPPTVEPATETTLNALTGDFVNGEVSVVGSYTLDVDHLTLTLSDDFRVDAGPDLFVVLSGVGDLSLDWQTFSAQALNAPLLHLGPLTSFTGAQTYTIPAGTGLAVYQSVVIWCNTYSVEFAAAPLRP